METSGMNYFEQESERLRYRKLTEADIPRWVDFFVDNDNLAYLGLDRSKSKEVLAEEWITKQFGRYQTQNLGHLAVELKETGEFIGMGGILPQVIDGKPEYEIGYSLLPNYWGKGFGTEIAQQLKRFGWENIETQRFVSIIDIRNQRSINVARKNGMTPLFRTQYASLTVDVYGIEKE